MALAVALILGVPSAAQAGVVLPCGSVITQDTRLGADMLNCPGTAVEIAGNATLNLGGHTISGTGSGTGVAFANGVTASVTTGVITSFGSGVFVGKGVNATLDDLQLSSNDSGVDGQGRATGLTLRRSVVMYNHRVGVEGQGGAQRYIGNTISHNAGLAGLEMNYAGTALFKNNEFSDNAGYGARVIDSTSTFVGNVASRNGLDGISADDAYPTPYPYLFTGNTANANGGLGISFTTLYSGDLGYADGGGNRARRNGDSRQCVGVTCS